jgi:hypothetical protein
VASVFCTFETIILWNRKPEVGTMRALPTSSLDLSLRTFRILIALSGLVSCCCLAMLVYCFVTAAQLHQKLNGFSRYPGGVAFTIATKSSFLVFWELRRALREILDWIEGDQKAWLESLAEENSMNAA